MGACYQAPSGYGVRQAWNNFTTRDRTTNLGLCRRKAKQLWFSGGSRFCVLLGYLEESRGRGRWNARFPGHRKRVCKTQHCRTSRIPSVEESVKKTMQRAVYIILTLLTHSVRSGASEALSVFSLVWLPWDLET